jgi:hypothetical protein
MMYINICLQFTEKFNLKFLKRKKKRNFNEKGEKFWTGRFPKTGTGSPVFPVQSGSDRFQRFFSRFLGLAVQQGCPDRSLIRFLVQPVEPAGPVFKTLLIIHHIDKWEQIHL